MQQGNLGFSNIIKVDPGGTVFTRGFSLETKHTVGRKNTVGQLIEKHVVMMLFMAMIMYIGIMYVTSRPKQFCTYYYYPTLRALLCLPLYVLSI